MTKETVARWKERLLEGELSPAMVNAKLSAVNGLLHFLGREECRAKFVKVQKRAFRDAARDLSREEYQRLLSAARQRGDNRNGRLDRFGQEKSPGGGLAGLLPGDFLHLWRLQEFIKSVVPFFLSYLRPFNVQFVRHLRLFGREQVGVAICDLDALMAYPVGDRHRRETHIY